MAQATANAITIEYNLHGAGEPLLLVMGLGGQLVSWPQGFIDALVNEGFQVVVFDNRDIGLSTKMKSPPPTIRQLFLGLISRKRIPTEYHLADMAADAVALLDALHIDSAHVVGISMGGMIAQTIAIDHPTRIRSLTSIMSTTGNRLVGRASASLIVKLPRLTRVTRETAVDKGVELFRLISGSSFDEAEARKLGQLALERNYDSDGTARQTAAIFASPDRTSALRSVKVPTLVVHGLEDTLVAPSGGIATAKAVPGARLLMFPDMGHNLPKARWEETIGAIVANTRRAAVEKSSGTSISSPQSVPTPTYADV
jgi:pimeloyl-ACP methyl ester carboxylesterase